jgi:hypothetical protein
MTTTTSSSLKLSSKFDYFDTDFESRTWCSNKTPKSVTKIDQDLTEYFYHCMKNIDFPMRVSYCWNFSESHRNFFNQTYSKKKACCTDCMIVRLILRVFLFYKLFFYNIFF